MDFQPAVFAPISIVALKVLSGLLALAAIVIVAFEPKDFVRGLRSISRLTKWTGKSRAS